MVKVVKFGGSSLADATQYRKVLDILSQDQHRRVIVVSAPGKRFPSDTKVTDLLIKYENGDENEASLARQLIIERYQAIAEAFKVSDQRFEPIREYLSDLVNLYYVNRKARLAHFKAAGEHLNAILMAEVLQAQGMSARFVDPSELGITVHGDYNNAILDQNSYSKIQDVSANLLSDTDYIVVPGFYAYNDAGEVCTFSRGGSDITGAILARGFQAEMYENFTDVDSIYSANPHVVKHPHSIREMTYREMRELSYAGFSVFHDEAIIPAIEAQIPIVVKNTNHPALPGTLIEPEQNFRSDREITGVVSSNHFAALYLHKYLLNREVGFTLKLLQILYRYGISYEHMPSGIDDLTIIFDKNQVSNAILPNLLEDIHRELQTDQLEWIDDYAILMIVGEGMRDKVGIVDRIVDALARDQIGIQMINQGASRISTMLGVHQNQADQAVRQIYKEFFESKVGVEQ
ncbi:aspartate kinase [Pediococcus stilesii]|uniref:Aspartokinase n=1 Tax=Pediococcus stilesii TaxID=331679 RepID=A0A5R9BZ19_9LACO|nr:aspartate kinase [Pediococcus stilesii]TLQ05735.1 aspartate kinase [Pediococcus stilesii]